MTRKIKDKRNASTMEDRRPSIPTPVRRFDVQLFLLRERVTILSYYGIYLVVLRAYLVQCRIVSYRLNGVVVTSQTTQQLKCRIVSSILDIRSFILLPVAECVRKQVKFNHWLTMCESAELASR